MKDEREIVDDALDAFATPEVSPELLERVMVRVTAPARAETAAPRAPRRWRAWAGAATVAALALALVVTLARHGRPAPSQAAAIDRHAALTRETLAIGGRAVAVAEGGADLSWLVAADGAARVEQRGGRVFYRVEPGAAFRVVTPAAEIVVTGTCFSVEVGAMRISRQQVVAAGLGAAASAAVLVTVYEGRVHVANARGDVAVGAGERASATADSAPSRTGNPTGASATSGTGATGATGEALAAAGGASAAKRDPGGASEATREQLQARLDAANARVATLEGQLAEARGPEADHVDPSKEVLAAWAKRCEIHIDAPAVFGAAPEKIDPKDAAEWGMTDEERPAVEKALAAMHGRARAEMRDIYIDATGNPTGADELTAGAMWGEVYEKALPADVVRARQRMARERAGLAAPPGAAELAATPAVERALRLLARFGGELESELAEGLGPERAHQLRKRYNAWPGMQYSSGGCDPKQR